MKKILIGGGVLLVIVVIVIVAVSSKRTVGESVYAGEATRGDVVTVVTGTGVIQPRTKVNISSEIYGQIVQIPVKEGQVVGKGELLIHIDPEKYRSEADRLEANVRVNRIAIESEDVSLKNLEIEQKRAHDLFKQGILSSSDKEKSDLAVDTARIQLKSLKETVTQAEAALSRAHGDLSKTSIFAPMPGKITQVNSEVGEQVIVGTTNIPGSVILVISDMSEVLAEVSVDETEVVRLQPGQKAKVTVDAVEKTTYEGRVTEIRNTAKKEGDVNVFGVKVLLTNPDERLRPGMTAKARIEVERRQDVTRVPIQAVTTRERKKLAEEQKKAAESASSASRSSSSKKPEGSAPGGTGAESAKASSGSASTGEAPRTESAGAEGASSGKSPRIERASESDASAKRSSPSGGDHAAQEPAASGAKPPAADPSHRPEGPGNPEDTRTGKDREAKQDEGTKKEETAKDEAGKDEGSKKDDRDEIEVVYLIEKDKVRPVPVKTGASDEAYVEIREGLKGGESVVKGPYRVLRRLKAGDRVITKKEDELAREAEAAVEESRSNED